MEQIEAHKAGRHVYADQFFFLYTLNKNVRGKNYYTCREREHGCMGSTSERIDGHLLSTITPHNHEPNVDDYRVLKFRQTLRHRARTESTSPAEIFRSEERRHPDVAAIVGGFNSVRGLLSRARQSGTPPVPRSLQDLDVHLHDVRWSHRYAREIAGPNELYHGLVEGEDRTTSAIFLSSAMAEFCNNREVHLHIDSTFKVVPRVGGVYQLCVVHVLHHGTVFPLLYALMERKTVAAYNAVFARIAALNINVRSVMTDYEDALRGAVAQVWPAAEIKGCWFHYAQAVFKKARALGLMVAANLAGRRATKMAMVLPLLPAERIADGVAELEAEPVDGVEELTRYLRRYWLPRNISVFREDHRTNNVVESFHRDLFRVVGRAHPNMWTLVEKIQHMEFSKRMDFIRLENGFALPARRRPAYRLLDRRIHGAQNHFEENGDVRLFLSYMCHTMDRLERLFVPAADPEISNDNVHTLMGQPV